MKAEFSEFTYGFSLVSELASALGCAAVPIFPSLIKEGRTGGGFDVKMGMGAVPLFLQFKLSEHLMTNNAKEAKHPSGLISAPYRRFQISSSATSKQHALLVGLSSNHSHVYYCAPDFYKNDDLNYLWGQGYVSSGSVFVHPFDVGNILDDKRHAVCFNGATLANNTCYLFSDPKPVKPMSLETLRLATEASLREAERPLRDLLPEWADLLENGRVAGEALHTEQVAAIEKLREERRLAAIEEDGLTLTEYQLRRSELARDALIGRIQVIPDAEPNSVRSRVPPRDRAPLEPDMDALMNLGRIAATEFQSQMFVLQQSDA